VAFGRELRRRGPRDRVYTATTADDGKVTVQFGDGRNGARLPTGQNNVRARYRKGVGREGMVSAGQLSLLMARPLGVKSTVNPCQRRAARIPSRATRCASMPRAAC